MADIDLERTHRLGLDRARDLARQWVAQAQDDFGMACTMEEGADGDTVHFKRSGVSGTLRVTAEAFELHARLGMLLGAFKQTIETQIESNLDTLLANGEAGSGMPPAA
jgi:putative polyhydroxyalkanoate system protein